MIKKILVINSHWNNRGDESALRAMVDSLHEIYPHAKFYVQFYRAFNVLQFPTSDYCENLQSKFIRKRAMFEMPLVLLSKGRLIITKETREFINFVKEMDLVIHGPGGPSIGDTYQHAEIIYLLKLMATYASGTPYIFYAPSMGPFNNKFRNIIRRFILNHAKLITVREPLSAEYLKKLNLKNNVIVTLDSAIQKMIVSSEYENEFAEYKELHDFYKKYKRVVGITITELNWQPTFKTNENIQLSIRKSFEDLLQYLSSLNYGVVFIPQLFGLQNDRDLMLNYAKMYENTFVLSDEYDCLFQQYLIGKLYAVVGLRYHSNIFSAKMCVPFISVSYEQKMKGFINKIGLEDYCIDVVNLNSDVLISKFKKLELEYSDYQKRLVNMQSDLKNKSYETTRLVQDVIKKIETNGLVSL